MKVVGAKAGQVRKKTVLVVGGGNLGGAIATRFARVGTVVCVVDKDERKLAALKQAGVASIETRLAHAKHADVAIVAVKPHQTTAVVAELKALMPSVVISVAAGVATRELKAACGAKSLLVRAMMNTAVAHGAGAVVLSKETPVPKWLRELLSALGEVHELDESLLDAAMAVTACAPAYFLAAVSGLTDGAVRLGIARSVAERLALAAAQGAAAVGAASGVAAAMAAIVSPGGTTAAGLAVIERAAVRAVFADAAEASMHAARGRLPGDKR